MVPRGLEHQVQLSEALERLVAPHFLLCEDSSVVYQPECHEEGCSHVRAEFSHFSNRALVPKPKPPRQPPKESSKENNGAKDAAAASKTKKGRK